MARHLSTVSAVRRDPKQFFLQAEKRLRRILKLGQLFPDLKSRCPQGVWTAQLVLVGRPKMLKLNEEHLGKSYSTDILSFPIPQSFRTLGGDGMNGRASLGDLVICLPVLRNQAKQMGHSLELELDILLIHGVLHLLGFDHEKSSVEASEMAAWERQLLNRLYAPHSKAPALSLGLIDRAKSDTKSK